MSSRGFTRIRGVALISVLLVVAILMAIATRIMAGHNLVINHHQNTFESDQALHYALGAETLAKQVLTEDFTRLGPDKDHLGEVWAQQTMPFEVDEGGFIEAQLNDLQGCLNLNNLAGSRHEEEVKILRRMLGNLGLPQDFAYHVKDWIDADMEPTQFGAEDSEYLIEQPPRRTPNDLILDTSELRPVAGPRR